MKVFSWTSRQRRGNRGKRESGGGAPFGLLNDERGFALILALAMLAILSILGAMSLSNSTTEIGISGNYRTSKGAFYAADRAVEYAMGNSSILYATSDTNLNDYADDLKVDTDHTELWTKDGTTNTVVNLGAGELPASLQAKFGNEFGAAYYSISVTGAQADSAGNALSKSRVETQKVRLFPKEDSSIFRTTSGG